MWVKLTVGHAYELGNVVSMFSKAGIFEEETELLGEVLSRIHDQIIRRSIDFVKSDGNVSEYQFNPPGNDEVISLNLRRSHVDAMITLSDGLLRIGEVGVGLKGHIEEQMKLAKAS